MYECFVHLAYSVFKPSPCLLGLIVESAIHVTHRSHKYLKYVTFLSFEVDMAFTLIDIDLHMLTFKQPLVKYKHVVKLYELLSRVDFRLIFIGKTNRLKEMLIFTIFANFVYIPCISDRNLFILLNLLQKLPCA